LFLKGGGERLNEIMFGKTENKKNKKKSGGISLFVKRVGVEWCYC
jgi:hypothetical protein